MLQSIVRFVLGLVLTWLVAKGAITQDQLNSNLPTIVEWVCMALVTFGGLLWAYLEKLAKGHITASGQSVTIAPQPSPVATVTDFRNLPSAPNNPTKAP